MVEQTRPLFVSFSTKVTSEKRAGSVEVFTQIQDMPITNEELAGIRRIQETAAAEIEKLLTQ